MGFWTIYGNKIFSGRKRHQNCEGFSKFRQQIPFPSSGCEGGLVALNQIVFVLPNYQHTGTDLTPETSKTLHILTLFSAQENFIEFCHSEIF
jgi:hypothetical protein